MSIDFRGVAAIVTLLFAGCAEEPQGERPFETNPVTGIVYVDGQPAERVQIDCHPVAESNTVKYALSTVTDKDGRFELTTYESGDGLPEGTYALTFQWLEVSLAPKDQLKGAYADPKQSQHVITVVSGQGNDIGIIELSSTGPE